MELLLNLFKTILKLMLTSMAPIDLAAQKIQIVKQDQ